MHVIRHDFATNHEALVPIVAAAEQIALEKYPGERVGYFGAVKDAIDRLIAGERMESRGCVYFVESGK